MKRVVICSVIMLLAVLLSVHSHNRVRTVRNGIDIRLEAIARTLEEEDGELLIARAAELESYWDEEENSLIHFVRHSHLDMITTAAARLPQLARHGEFGEFGAEVYNIKRQIEHIFDNERLTFSALL